MAVEFKPVSLLWEVSTLGESIKSYPLLLGLSSEGVDLRLTEIGTRYKSFEATYLGVLLGNLLLEKSLNGTDLLTWS